MSTARMTNLESQTCLSANLNAHFQMVQHLRAIVAAPAWVPLRKNVLLELIGTQGNRALVLPLQANPASKYVHS